MTLAEVADPANTAPIPDGASTSPVPVFRDEKGRFPAGVSGNPHGRAKGTKNRITLARLMLEETLREQLTNKGSELMGVAIQMAMGGDDKIMRVLLDKMLATPKGDDADNAKDTEVRVLIQNMTTGSPAAIEATRVTLRPLKEHFTDAEASP